MVVINLEKVGYIIHEMFKVQVQETSSNSFERRGYLRDKSTKQSAQFRDPRNWEGWLGSFLGNPIQCNRSGKSDGETIRGDGKGINVSRKSKPGVGHKFPISSFFGTASRTNSFVASVSSPILLSPRTREEQCWSS